MPIFGTYSIAFVVGAVKDIFWNWIQYKGKFKAFIDSNISYGVVVKTSVSVLFLSASSSFLFLYLVDYNYDVVISMGIVAMFSFEMLFLINKILYNASETYYTYGVKNLIIHLNDGKCYSHIQSYYNNKDIVIIELVNGRRLYIPKNSITYIERIRNNKTIYQQVLENIAQKHNKAMSGQKSK